MNESYPDPLPVPIEAPPGYDIPRPPAPSNGGGNAPAPFNPYASAASTASGGAVDPFRPATLTPSGEVTPATTDPADAAVAERSGRVAAMVAAGVGLLLLMAMFGKRKNK